MNIERVEFSREGGITGIPLKVEFDSQSLEAEERTELQKLLEAADFFSLPSVLGEARSGADRFAYTITVEGDGKRSSVRATDPVPESIQDLVSFLVRVAKQQRRKQAKR